MSRTASADFERDYDREMLRSELVSLFWAIVTERKKGPDGFTLQQLADHLGINKSQVSRWFGGMPNWEINTVSDIAGALGVDLQFTARDRHDGKMFTSNGCYSPPVVTATASNGTFIARETSFSRTHAPGSVPVAGMAA